MKCTFSKLIFWFLIFDVLYMFWIQGKTAYTDACKTHYTMPVYTIVFLKMNPRVQNV